MSRSMRRAGSRLHRVGGGHAPRGAALASSDAGLLQPRRSAADMPELRLLHTGAAEAVLAFELANRGYFAATVPDRGDDYFARFSTRYAALLAEQDAGICAFYLLVADDGSVVGRFNLYDLRNGAADLGYRVARNVAGRGVATSATQELCRLAANHHRLRLLRAATSSANIASRRVLVKAGFVPVGPADPSDLDGEPGTWFRRELTPVR